MKKITTLILAVLSLMILTNSCSEDSSSEPDNNSAYESVKIGNQVWMTKNLDVVTYQNGDPIPEVTDQSEWADLTTGAWCYYDNDPANGEIYGKLYNWYAVNDPRGLAPEGWHVPTDAEWKELEMSLGISQSEADNSEAYRGTDQGAQLAGMDDLWDPGDLRSGQSFGSSGFIGLPAGYRYVDFDFSGLGINACWWTASDYSGENAWYRELTYYHTEVFRGKDDKGYGFSVRCVKD